LALQYNMMNFIGNDKYGKDLIPAHSVLGYNNEPHTYKWTSDGTIDFKILDSKVTIKGEPIKSVVYNQPFSNYQERIDSVNKLLEIAKNTKKEEDIKEARKLAQTLIDSEERKDILKQLDSIGKNDELQYEIGALVVELENSDVIDSNKFEKLKEMLNNASEEIVEEFKTIYDKIQKRYEIENLIKETEGNLTEENLDKLSNLLDNANIENKYKLSYISKYDRFLNNYTKKVEEQEQAEYQAKVQNVTKAVEKAENSKNQTDVDNARVVVNSLKDTDKSNLNTRLDKIQKDIDDKKTEEEKQAEYAAKVQNATKAVEKAERTTIYEDYISATNLVSNLQDSEIKIQLWDRLGEVKVDIGRKEEATRLVKLAEEDNTETNYNRALESINRLRDNELKKDLLNRLNKVKTTIDNNKAKEEEKAKNQRALEEAIKVVEQAERENEEKSYSEALVIVNVLEESASKKELLDRLYEVKINIENIKTNKAIELVKYAERYPSITSYNNAKDAVNVIRDGNIKSELLNNLKNVEDRIKKLDKETEKNNP
ncbi:MAG: viral A-type inclusion protein, partial [Clostridium botulinum]|nr:viral A-type inclusion protein [Clostridium botulinum]